MFVIPNHPKAPYLKALLVFILSTRYRVTREKIEELRSALDNDIKARIERLSVDRSVTSSDVQQLIPYLDEDIKFHRCVLELVGAAGQLASSEKLKDKIYVNNILATWISGFPKQEMPSLVHLAMEASDSDTLKQFSEALPFESSKHSDNYHALQRQLVIRDTQNLDDLFMHFVEVLVRGDTKFLFEVVRKQYLVGRVVVDCARKDLLGHCLMSGAYLVASFLFKEKLLQLNDLLLFNEVGNSLLLGLCQDRLGQKSLLKLFDLNFELSLEISAEAWCRPITEGECAGESPLLHLCGTEHGRQFVLKLFNARPEFYQKISIDVWCRAPMWGASAGKSALYFLCLNEDLWVVLSKVFEMNPQFYTEISVAAWCQPVLGDPGMGGSPLFGLCANSDRRSLLLKLIKANSNFASAVPEAAWSRTMVVERIENVKVVASPLSLLSNCLLGRQILLELVKSDPSFARRVPAEWWFQAVQRGVLNNDSEDVIAPLLCFLFFSEAGRVRIRSTISFYEQIPTAVWCHRVMYSSNSGESPLFWLFGTVEGQQILPGLLKINPNFIRSIPTMVWVQPITAGEYAGKAPLYFLCGMPAGKQILLDFFTNNPEFYREVPIEAWCRPVEQGLNAGTTPIFWLCESELGRQVLVKMLQVYPEVIQAISVEAWSRVATQGKYVGKPPLSILCESSVGAQILKMLFKINPKFSQGAIVNWLCEHAEGRQFLLYLVQENPNILEESFLEEKVRQRVFQVWFEITNLIIPNHSKAPYLKMLLAFILSMGYRVTSGDFDKLKSALQNDVEFLNKSLELVRMAIQLAGSRKPKDRVSISNILAEWMPGYPRKAMPSLVHLLIASSSLNTLGQLATALPNEALVYAESYDELYEQPAVQEVQHLPKLFAHLIGVLRQGDVKAIYEEVVRQGNARVALQKKLLGHCLECNAYPVALFLFKEKLLQFDELLLYMGGDISQRKWLLKFFDLYPSLYRDIPVEAWYRPITQGEYAGTSPLFWLCGTDEGRQFFAARAELYREIPVEAWCCPVTQGNNAGASPLFWLCNSPLGRQILKRLATRVRPSFIEAVSAEAWSRVVTEGEYAGKSPLDFLCSNIEGHSILFGLLETHPQLCQKIPVSTWCRPVEQGEHAGASLLFWFCRTAQGQRILLKLFEVNQNFTQEVPTEAWCRPVTQGEYRGRSPLHYLCEFMVGREFLLQLLNANPSLCQTIPITVWSQSVDQIVPLSALCKSATGAKILLLLFKINPEFYGETIMTWLCNHDEGKRFLVYFVQKNPSILEIGVMQEDVLKRVFQVLSEVINQQQNFGITPFWEKDTDGSDKKDPGYDRGLPPPTAGM